MSLKILPSLILSIFAPLHEEIQKSTFKLLNVKQHSAEGLKLSWVVSCLQLG